MTKNYSTAESTSNDDITGNKLYQQRARIALPILVRQAKAEQTISYADLAKELEMPNARNLNFVLGAIGNSLSKLEEIIGEKIPLINALVVNKKTGLPGEGIEWFLENKKNYDLSSKKQKKTSIQRLLQEIFIFKNWDLILSELNLEPVANILSSEEEVVYPKYSPIAESESHRIFKENISKYPQVLELPTKFEKVEIEFSFPTQDEVDVLFTYKDAVVGVEVKSKISDENDIRRGLFQCVKYQALLEANQMLEQRPINVDTILALEDEFPNGLLPIKNTLGIKVIDNIGIKLNKLI
jgi:hypothetical protein